MKGKKRAPLLRALQKKRALSKQKKRAGEGRRKITPFSKKRRNKSAPSFFCFQKKDTKSKGERKKSLFKKKRKKKRAPSKKRAKKGAKKSALFIFKGAP